MKLVYAELEKQLVFQENKVNVLVIERKELLLKSLISRLAGKREDLFYLIIIKQ